MQKNLEPEVEARARKAMQAALAWRVLRHIEQHPDTWLQGRWHCGTAFCFAGHTVEMTGGRWVSDDPLSEATNYVRAEPDDDVVDGDCWVHARDRARRVLGLATGQASKLFSACNDMELLHAYVERFFGPEPPALEA